MFSSIFVGETFPQANTPPENPVHTYTAAGVYDVTLIATANPGGCTGVIVQTVTVVEGPELTIDPSAPVICAGDDVLLDLSKELKS